MEKVICNYFDNLCLIHKHFYATMPDMDLDFGPFETVAFHIWT